MFNAKFVIEAFGYLGSFLVLVSMLMTSVMKLRIINTIGSTIFTIYALIIHSYPTAFMNFCLILINLYYLYKMSKVEKVHKIVECKNDDALLDHLINYYKDDIIAIFPGVDLDLTHINKAYVVLCEGKPVGLTLGRKEGDDLVLNLDYSIPEHRDFSIGSFLFNYIKGTGIKRVIYKGPDENHKEYLASQGFVKQENVYIKEF